MVYTYFLLLDFLYMYFWTVSSLIQPIYLSKYLSCVQTGRKPEHPERAPQSQGLVWPCPCGCEATSRITEPLFGPVDPWERKMLQCKPPGKGTCGKTSARTPLHELQEAARQAEEMALCACKDWTMSACPQLDPVITPLQHASTAAMSPAGAA